MPLGCLGACPQASATSRRGRGAVGQGEGPLRGAVAGCNPHRRPPASMGGAGGRRKRENLGQPNPALKSSLILSFLRTPEPRGWCVGAGGCRPSWLEQLQPSAVLVSSKVQFLQDGRPRAGSLLLRSHPSCAETGMQLSGQKEGEYIA